MSCRRHFFEPDSLAVVAAAAMIVVVVVAAAVVATVVGAVAAMILVGRMIFVVVVGSIFSVLGRQPSSASPKNSCTFVKLFRIARPTHQLSSGLCFPRKLVIHNCELFINYYN